MGRCGQQERPLRGGCRDVGLEGEERFWRMLHFVEGWGGPQGCEVSARSEAGSVAGVVVVEGVEAGQEPPRGQ